jgi:hypothetical protein
MATREPPEGAALARVTVQVVLEFEERVEAPHCRAETTLRTISESVAGLVEPFKVALMVAVSAKGITPVLAVKLTVVAAAGTVT